MRFRLAGGESVFLTFEGASQEVNVKGREEQHARYHYFLGNDPDRWVRDVPTYSSVKYEAIQTGVDLTLRLVNGLLEYDIELASGVRAEDVVIKCRGARSLDVDSDGALGLTSEHGILRQSHPIGFMLLPSGGRVPIACKTKKLAEDRFAFTCDAQENSAGVVIDPSVMFSAFVGGSGTLDRVFRLKCGPDGAVYAAGATDSLDFPVTAGAHSTSISGIEDGFVAKFAADGSAVVWATFLGGSDDDTLRGLDVSSLGEVCVCGETLSLDYPITAGAFDSALSSVSDAAVTRISADGGSLLFSTYLGGSAPFLPSEVAHDVAIDTSGIVYVVGEAISTDFPTTPGACDSVTQATEAFVTALNPAGTAIAYSTFLGGVSHDFAYSVRVTPTHEVLVAGETSSADFPVTPNAYDMTKTLADAFVTRMDATLSSVLASTFVGGNNVDTAYGVALDPFGDVVIAGTTDSFNFPTTGSCFQPMPGGLGDGFVARLDTSMTTLKLGTYLGKGGTELLYGLSLDASGSVIVAGHTLSPNFPVTATANQAAMSGTGDAFLSEFSRDGKKLLYSTFIGGHSWEDSFAVASAPGGLAYVAGETHSRDFPVTPNAFDTTFDTSFFNTDGFLMGFNLCRGAVSSYGQGCAGSGAFVPSLAVDGCPASGELLTLRVTQGLGAAPMVLAFGAGQSSAPIVGSCAAQIMPLFPSLLISLPLFGQGAGNGTFEVSAPLPIPTPTGSVTLQAFIGDSGAQDGVAATQAIKLDLVD